MNKLDLLKKVITKKTARKILILKKFSPEISLVLGGIGFGTCVVLACKATLKAKESKEYLDFNISETKKAKEEKLITEQEYTKDIAQHYVQGALEIGKLYLPAVGIGVLSLGLIYNSHRIMRSRNFALVAAYKAIDESFSLYRGKVINELGEDKDRQFKYGLRTETMITTEENDKGKLKEVKKSVSVLDDLGYSKYARFYDETCKAFHKNPEYNLMFLKTQQDYANDLLYARGHVFLNEVYDSLGIERSSAGQVVGWVLDKNNPNKIDFGIFDGYKKSSRNFVNGYEPVILLDFNVDGLIYDKI